jgi:alpha-1,2-mannosyltransferase
MTDTYWNKLRILPVVAASIWLLVAWVRIYSGIQPNDFYNHWEFGRRFAMGTFIYENGLNYVYPPLWALVHAPLTVVTPGLAKAIVFPLAPLSIAVLLWVLNRLVRDQLPCDSGCRFWSAVLAVVLASRFLARDLQEVGANTFLVAVSWLGLYCWRERRENWGGVLLGLAAALKCTPLLFVAWFVLKRQWRMMMTTMAATVLFTMAPMLVMGPASYSRTMQFWFAGVVKGVGDPDPSRGPLGEEKVDNLALRPALARYLMHLPHGHLGRPEASDDPARPNNPPSPYYLQFLDLTPGQAGWVVRVVMLGLLFVVVWWFRRLPRSRDDPLLVWEWAAVSLLILLFSPITWAHHCVGALPAIYLISRAFLARYPIPRFAVYAVGAYGLLVVVLNRAFLGRDLTKLLNSYRVVTLAILLLLAAVIICWHQLLRRLTASQPQEGRYRT